MLSETELAYAAGVIDGEAHVGIKRDRPDVRRKSTGYTPEVKVEMVDEELVRWLHARFGGRLRGPRRTRQHRRPVYVWATLGQNSVDVLRAVAPYLVVKRRHAGLIVDFWERRVNFNGRAVPAEEMDRRQAYYDAVKRLNYGPSTLYAAG